jgi:hypothetical protein
MTATITWTCTRCGKPIEDKTGWVRVSMREVMRVEDARRAYDDKHPPGKGINFADFMEYPEPVHWQAVHESCLSPTDDDEGDYAIPVDEIRTPWRALDWSAQVMEKTWAEHTDWVPLMRQLGTTKRG